MTLIGWPLALAFVERARRTHLVDLEVRARRARERDGIELVVLVGFVLLANAAIEPRGCVSRARHEAAALARIARRARARGCLPSTRASISSVAGDPRPLTTHSASPTASARSSGRRDRTTIVTTQPPLPDAAWRSRTRRRRWRRTSARRAGLLRARAGRPCPSRPRSCTAMSRRARARRRSPARSSSSMCLSPSRPCSASAGSTATQQILRVCSCRRRVVPIDRAARAEPGDEVRDPVADRSRISRPVPR